MKSIFLSIVILGYTVNFSFAQEKNDTIANKQNKWNKRIFISAGINSTQYYSDAFFSNLFDKTYSLVNGSPSTYQYPYTVTNNTFSRNINYYNKSSLSPIVSLGLELGSSCLKKIKLNHIMHASYTQFSGNYTVSSKYEEYYNREGSPAFGWNANIKDTIQSKYTQTAISLGYKFQPTFKFVFFSIGINCSVNLVKVNQNKTSPVNGTWYDEWGGKPYSNVITSNTIIKIHFINFPFELGGGGNFKIKKIILKPAFYFTPSFIKGYNFYAILLGVGYTLKNKKNESNFL